MSFVLKDPKRAADYLEVTIKTDALKEIQYKEDGEVSTSTKKTVYVPSVQPTGEKESLKGKLEKLEKGSLVEETWLKGKDSSIRKFGFNLDEKGKDGKLEWYNAGNQSHLTISYDKEHEPDMVKATERLFGEKGLEKIMKGKNQ